MKRDGDTAGITFILEKSLLGSSPSPYSLKIYSMIQKKGKRKIITADVLFENKSAKTTERLVNAIHDLQAQGLITLKSIVNRGRFETELIPKEGYVERVKPAKRNPVLQEGESNLCASEDSYSAGLVESSVAAESPRPKRKYQRRKVRRSLV